MKSPGDYSKHELGKLVLEAAEKVLRGNNRLPKLSVFGEPHANGQLHYHCPMVADKPFVAGPLRKALAAERVYCYIESCHAYYWSLILYLAVPRPEKTVDDSPRLCDGHEPILERLQNIPRGANRADKDRCLAYLGKKNQLAVKLRVQRTQYLGIVVM